LTFIIVQQQFQNYLVQPSETALVAETHLRRNLQSKQKFVKSKNTVPISIQFQNREVLNPHTVAKCGNLYLAPIRINPEDAHKEHKRETSEQQEKLSICV
jgi:hypothetical protein